MTRSARTLAAAAAVALAAWAAPADWPQWGRDNARNMVSTARDLPATFKPGLLDDEGTGIDPDSLENVRWVARLGTSTCGNPIVAEGRVLVGSNDASLADPRLKRTRGGLLSCFDAASGKLQWKLVVPRLAAKIEGNRCRDARVESDLRGLGWNVVTVWGCALKTIAARESRPSTCRT